MVDLAQPTASARVAHAAQHIVQHPHRAIDRTLDVDTGAVPIDAGSLKPRGENEPMVERWLADEASQAKLRTTTKVVDVDASTYDAVFFPVGHGTMWDLPGDAGVKRAVENAYGAGKLVASVCHGAAGLVSAQGADVLNALGIKPAPQRTA